MSDNGSVPKFEESELINWRGFKVIHWNFPLQRPGLYGLFCISSKLWYIGASKNVYTRICTHPEGCKKLQKALIKYGKNNFIVFPLYYSISNEGATLFSHELSSIFNFDSIKNGYNVKDYGGNFDNSKVISNYMKEYHKLPETKLLLQKTLEKRWAVDGARKKQSQSISKLKWITNGVSNSRVEASVTIPKGWKFGRSFSKEYDHKGPQCRVDVRTRKSKKTKQNYLKRRGGVIEPIFRVCYKCFSSFKLRPTYNLEQPFCSSSCASRAVKFSIKSEK